MYEYYRKHIDQFYHQAKREEEFLESFEELVISFVKDNKTAKRIDYRKLSHLLRNAATVAKKENLSTTKYLQKVTEIVAYTLSGKGLNPSQKDIFNFSPSDIDQEDLTRKPYPSFTPRKHSKNE